MFHSALDDFREEDDEEERDADLADFYALQRSRRVFEPRRPLEDSGETNEDGLSTVHNSREEHTRQVRHPRMGRGIKSSWDGGKQHRSERRPEPSQIHNKGKGREERRSLSDASSADSKGKMVDIGLESVLEDHSEINYHSDDSDEPPYDLTHDPEESENEQSAYQESRHLPKRGKIRLPDSHFDLNKSSDIDIDSGTCSISRPLSVVSTPPADSVIDQATTTTTVISGPIRHDTFFSSLYLISLAALFATSFLVWLHTDAPSKKMPLGDTIYTALRSSYYLLAMDTLLAVIVALIWLACLRSFVRPLVYGAVIGVPIILFSFSIYTLVSSYKGNTKGAGLQDRTMRWFSFVPLVIAGVWSYTLLQGRHSLHKAVAILEWASCRILGSNPGLLTLGVATLATTILWTWIWLSMFSRVFLSGHFASSASKFFIIDVTTWWLGAWYVSMYLWTLGVLAGIQRVVTGAGVSQWYFHRGQKTPATSRDIIEAGLVHATTVQLGTICLSSLLALLIRLPMLVLPRRAVSVLALFMHSLIPSPVASLLSPLTLTYAGIQSQPLSSSARALSNMTFLVDNPTNTLAPRTFQARRGGNDSPLLPYRLAKMLLYATRFIMAVSLGFGAWVSSARDLDIGTVGKVKGSLYAYVVGMVAGFIGWGVLGAMEGVMVGILDGAVICYGIEKGAGGGTGQGYCVEAEWMFGGGREGGRIEDSRY